MMSNLLERSDRTEVTLERSRYVCMTPECVCGVPVNECCEPTLRITAPLCAAEAETCVGTHVAFGNVALECEAVGQCVRSIFKS